MRTWPPTRATGSTPPRPPLARTRPSCALALRTREERGRALHDRATALEAAAVAEIEARARHEARRQRRLREAEVAEAVRVGAADAAGVVTRAVVVTDDELEIPLEARGCRCSGPTTWTADGVRSGWSRTSWRTSGSATASPLGRWQRHLAARGVRLLRGVAVVGGVGGPSADRRARGDHDGWRGSRRTSCSATRAGADVRRPGLQARSAGRCTPSARRSGTQCSS